MIDSAAPQSRSNGWTPERQLRFLDALVQTRSVSAAAADAGLSRESAYRLRARAGLFALLWDRALQVQAGSAVHTVPLTDGRVARFLGNQFRRQSGGFHMSRKLEGG